MQANCRTFDQILKGPCQYRVPLFQRRYEWQREQWNDLWDDILELMQVNERRVQEPASEHTHFMGTIVCRKAFAQHDVEVFDLIDGQQRLITITLILQVLLLIHGSPKQGTDFEGLPSSLIDLRSLLLNQGELPAEYRLRVSPSRDDRVPYSGLFKEGKHNPSNDPVVDAFLYYERALRAQLRRLPDKNDKNRWINNFVATIRKNLLLAWITLDSYDNEYEIFESINAKGMKLSEADKVRNFCFMHLEPLSKADQFQFHAQHWVPMEEQLSATKFGKFMVAWTTMRSGWLFSDKKLYNIQSDFIESELHKVGLLLNQSAGTAAFILDYFREMVSYATPYCAILDGSVSTRQDLRWVNDLLVAFNDSLNTRDSIHPVLIYVLKAFWDHPSDEAGLLCCLRTLESFTVRRYLCHISKGTSHNERVFALTAYALHKSACETPSDCARALPELLNNPDSHSGWPSDEQIRDAVMNNDQWSRGIGNRFAEYVLRRIETKQNPEIGDGISDCYVCHIMPLKAQGDWVALPVEVLRRCCNLLGNLALMPKNHNEETSYLNKRAEFRSATALTTRNISWERWGEEQVKERGESLFREIVKLWPIAESNFTNPPSEGML